MNEVPNRPRRTPVNRPRQNEHDLREATATDITPEPADVIVETAPGSQTTNQDAEGTELPAPNLEDMAAQLSFIEGNLIVGGEPVNIARFLEVNGFDNAALNDIVNSDEVDNETRELLRDALSALGMEVTEPTHTNGWFSRTARTTGRGIKTTVLVPWHLTKTGASMAVDGLKTAKTWTVEEAKALHTRFMIWLQTHPRTQAFLGFILAGAGIGLMVGTAYIVIFIILLAALSVVGLIMD